MVITILSDTNLFSGVITAMITIAECVRERKDRCEYTVQYKMMGADCTWMDLERIPSRLNKKIEVVMQYVMYFN